MFDALGSWLHTGQVATTIAWADLGLHFAFTEAFLRQSRQAAAAEGPAAFDDYLTTTSYEDDQATNVDRWAPVRP